jgi:DNA-directed RNA polymerase
LFDVDYEEKEAERRAAFLTKQSQRRVRRAAEFDPHADPGLVEQYIPNPQEGPITVAYLAMRVALDGIATNAKVTDAATRLCDFIIDELRYRRLKEQDPQLYDWKLAQFDTSSYRHMKGSLDMTLRYAGVDVAGLKMTRQEKLIVGIKLLNVVAEVTGIVDVDNGLATRITSRRRGNMRHQTLYLKPGEGITEWIGDKTERMSDLTYALFPMVVPPIDWAPMQRGGYRFKLRSVFPMIRTRNEQVSFAAERAHLPVVFGALNTLQQTAWRINGRVLSVVRALRESGGGVAGLASKDSPAPLFRPASIDADYETWTTWRNANRGLFTRARGKKGKQKAGIIPPEVEAARLRWKAFRRRLGELKDADAPRRSQVVSQGATVRVAQRVAEYPAIYFPYTLDWRGRVYPVCSFLNPQGDDLSKALLTFASGKPLGDEGARWLAIHGANLYDTTPEGQKISKMTLEDRERWIVRQSQHIRASVADPINNLWWQQADKPLQFLAFCFEWVEAQAERARTGEWSYSCSLPVSMDGSCNGLQHLSAMFRDEKGGRSVNLTANDTPRDVYNEIAECVKDLLTKSNNPVALLWLQSGLVDRKLCKRPTMTFGYGSKQYGFRDQLLEELKGRADYEKIKRRFQFEDEAGETKDGFVIACTFLASCIETALQNTVVAAALTMKWLQDYATQISNAGKAVEWVVPVTGWRVRQHYFKATMRRVNTTLAGKNIRPASYTDSDVVARHKQANAVSPNIVHSFDAAVLMLTVGECQHEGITSLRMVHDSFGTLAADAPRMAEIARRVFVNFYHENDVAGLIAEQLTAQLEAGAVIPDEPPTGKLDLFEVLDSKYFFA